MTGAPELLHLNSNTLPKFLAGGKDINKFNSGYVTNLFIKTHL